MKIKQTAILPLIAAALFLSVVGVFAGESSVNAYMCEKSGPNKDGKSGTGRDMIYEKGSCIAWKPDSKKGNADPIYAADGKTVVGHKECPDGQVKHGDNSCWTYRQEYNDYRPTYDDGTDVPRATWDSICGKLSQMGVGFHYEPSRHRCESAGGCAGIGKDSTNGTCRAIGENTGTPDEIFKDETGRPKKDCESRGAKWDGAAKKCTDTKDSCGKKPNSVWVQGQCKLYSDYTNKDDCINIAKGEFKLVDAKDPANPNDDVWACQKPGGPDGSPDDPPQKGQGSFQAVNTKNCGKARTNLIECGKDEGASAIGKVLKAVLTIMSVGVGILAVGGIVYGAALYASAQDNAAQTKKAIEVIMNTVIGLLLYIFMYSILNWLVPGGVFT